MPTKLYISFILLILALICASSVYAFGHEGHETTGAIAAKLIAGTRAEKEVANILHPGEDLLSAAVWADRVTDCIKGSRRCRTNSVAEMKAFTRKNPHHHAYHFTDIPFEQGAYDEHAIGANEEDVVHILSQAIFVLQGKESPVDNPHGFTKREALFLVAHLTGDIHQPLHVGAAYLDKNNRFVDPKSFFVFVSKSEDEVQSDGTVAMTRGGNYLLLGSHNLHSLWDTDLVHRAMRRNHATTPNDFADALLANGYQKPAALGSPDAWPKKWADESVSLSRHELDTVTPKERMMVTDKDGSHAVWSVALPRTYIPNGTRQVEKQIYLAGTRLADVLKAVWP